MGCQVTRAARLIFNRVFRVSQGGVTQVRCPVLTHPTTVWCNSVFPSPRMAGAGL